ncbi:hypothetical protein VSR68_40805 [Paraburkholderia phymatum]|uniref:hypothetical protein n=1 Tax=Paraburkholderia phymatum TaxID=148447 RepID=UPI003177DEE9
MTTHPQFRVGDSLIGAEGGSSYGPDLPDPVSFAVCGVKRGGKSVRRKAVNLALPRRTVLRIALRMLAHADGMMPDTTSINREAAACAGHPPQVLNHREEDRGLIDRLRDNVTLNFARMPALHAAQAMLEHCDEGTAAGPRLLIAAADSMTVCR